eukprot:330785-Chlamydomonas_euryale.AAC.1
MAERVDVAGLGDLHEVLAGAALAIARGAPAGHVALQHEVLPIQEGRDVERCFDGWGDRERTAGAGGCGQTGRVGWLWADRKSGV